MKTHQPMTLIPLLTAALCLGGCFRIAGGGADELLDNADAAGSVSFTGSPPGYGLPGSGTAVYLSNVSGVDDPTVVVLSDIPWTCASFLTWLDQGSVDGLDSTYAMVQFALAEYDGDRFTGSNSVGIYETVPEEGPEDGRNYTVSSVLVGDLPTLYAGDPTQYSLLAGTLTVTDHGFESHLNGAFEATYESETGETFDLSGNFEAIYCL